VAHSPIVAPDPTSSRVWHLRGDAVTSQADRLSARLVWRAIGRRIPRLV
jgi:hypothetical protein